MAMNKHVHVIVTHDTHIRLAADGDGGSKEDVREVRSDHRADPTVGKGSAKGRKKDVLVIAVNAFMRAVQGLDDLAVNAARDNPTLLPALPGALGCAGIRVQWLSVLVPHAQGRLGYVDGDLRVRAVHHVNVPFCCNPAQFLPVLDLVTFGLALCREQ